MRAMRACAMALGVVAALACGGEEPPPESAAAPGPARTSAAGSGNGAPVIERIALAPERPRPGDQVVARVSARDPDGDDVELEYRWSVAGENIGESTSFLDLGDVARGSVVEVTVTASDGAQKSPPSRATARVGNQPPQVTGVAIEPMSPVTTGRDLVATPGGEDPDGDRIRYRYRWLVDGEPLPDEAPTLRGDRFARGDSIVLEVVASDGTDDSETFRSDPIEVANAPPRITSTPGAIGADGVFRYDVVTEDPDGDTAFRYRLVTAPAGMTIGFDDGRLSWRPGDESEGSHAVEVEVSDLFGGRSTQPFEIRLSYASPEDAPPASASDDDADADADADAEAVLVEDEDAVTADEADETDDADADIDADFEADTADEGDEADEDDAEDDETDAEDLDEEF